MNRPIRVVLADDHPVVRRGLAAIIDIEDDIEIVGQAANGQEAVALVLSLQPDVVLMDLQMPRMDGVEAIARIRAKLPETQVIVLTTFADDDYIYKGVAAGARGYLLKDAPADDLIEAIRAAHRGESLLNPEVAARILDRFSSLINQPDATRPKQEAEGKVEPVIHIQKEPDTPYRIDQPTNAIALWGPTTKRLFSREAAPTEPSEIGPHNHLTPREMDVLALMAQGARNKEIAQALSIAERTVKIHVGHILGKLEAGNRTEAVAVAMKLGLLED